jgi:hypothetical protein
VKRPIPGTRSFVGRYVRTRADPGAVSTIAPLTAQPSHTAVDVLQSDPSVDEATIVPNLIAAILSVHDEVDCAIGGCLFLYADVYNTRVPGLTIGWDEMLVKIS